MTPEQIEKELKGFRGFLILQADTLVYESDRGKLMWLTWLARAEQERIKGMKLVPEDRVVTPMADSIRQAIEGK